MRVTAYNEKGWSGDGTTPGFGISTPSDVSDGAGTAKTIPTQMAYTTI